MDNLLTPFFAELTAQVRQAVREELAALQSSRKGNTGVKPETDSLLTIPQAAEFLGVTLPTIYGYINKNTIPHMKPFGKKVYFSKEGLTEWIKQSRRKTNSELKNEADILISKNRRA